MAIPDDKRYNLLYKPVLGPTRDWRSEAVFSEPVRPVGGTVEEPPAEDLLQDLRDLEEVADGLPEGLEPVKEIVTRLRQRAEILKVEEELQKIVNPPGSFTPSTLPGYPTVSPEPSPVTVQPPPSLPGVDFPWGPGGTEIETITGVPPVYPPVSVLPFVPETLPSDSLPGSKPPDEPPWIPVPPPTVTPPDIPVPVTVSVPGTTPSIPVTVSLPGETYGRTTPSIPATGTVIIPEEEPYVPFTGFVDTEDTGIDGLPTSFAPKTTITLSVETPRTLVQIAQDSYKSDQLDLQRFYLQKMRMALQRYFHHLLGLTAELNLSDPDMLTKNYDGDNVTGFSANARHLHDTIVRSQIQRLQKARVFKKVANTDQTLCHMRAWHAAEKERERYYNEAYGDSEEFVDSESNALLRQARADYDAAYKLALYNMYKYLDASVKLTEDILDHTLTEAKAKAKLIKEGVNIYKTEEVYTSSQTNAVQSLQPKTKEQKAAEDKAEAEADKNRTQLSSKLTAADIDKLRGVDDPDEQFELAPSGGHYSKSDIDYLVSINPELYNRDTVEGRTAIRATLDQADKYAKGEESNATANGTDSIGSAQQTEKKQESLLGITIDDITISTDGTTYGDLGLGTAKTSKDKVEKVTK